MDEREFCIQETMKHKRMVNSLINIIVRELRSRGKIHDNSKLEDPEIEGFIKYTPKLKDCEFGSEEYNECKKQLKSSLDHHYKNNKHHPEWEDYNILEWKDIKDYEGIYQISNYGDIKRLSHTVERKKQGNFNVPEIILKASVTPKGYLRVQLSKNGSKTNYMVHRLVALHFINNLEDKPQINHKDTNKKNNYYKNLEWCDNSENQLHAYKNDLQKIKYIVHCLELNLTTLGCGEMKRKLKELGYEKARESSILNCINGNCNSHLKLHFEGSLLEEYQRSKLSNMNLVDLVEMFCDWLAATKRHETGNIHNSIKINQERFGYDDILTSIFENTSLLLEERLEIAE